MDHRCVRMLAAFFLFVLTACTATLTTSVTPTPEASAVAPEIRAWLKQNAIPFTSTQPGSNNSDLIPLKKIVGDARIIALGEATHGTHEFFQMKHRLVEFLVQEMGFTVFAMEANAPEANLLNDYLQTGQGDPAKLLNGLGFWTWDTQEVLDLIKWMRSYNASHPNLPIRFAGIDMQSPSSAMKIVIEYLNRVDPTIGQQVNGLFDCIRPYQSNPQAYAYLSQGDRMQCRENLQSAYQLLIQHQTEYVARSSELDFAQALHSVRLVQQFEDVFGIGYGNGAARDRYLAENLSWALDHAGSPSKVIVWAHNAHVGVNSWSGDSMGTNLRRQYGNAFLNIGFLFYSGTFNAYSITASGQFGNLTTHQAEPPPSNSYEYYFHSAGLPQYFLNLRDIQGSAVETNWLTQHQSLRNIGAAYDESHPEAYFQAAVLPEMFDVVIYFDHTSPSQLLTLPSSRQPVQLTYPLQAQNLDFENGTAKWAIFGKQPEEYVIDANSDVAHSGKIGGFIRNRVANPSGYATLAQMIATDLYRGRRLRLSAYLKTDNVSGGAEILMRVDGVDKILGISNMQNRPIKGTTDWARYEIVLDIPAESVDIMFGVWLTGTGQVAFDDFQLEMVGTDGPITP